MGENPNNTRPVRSSARVDDDDDGAAVKEARWKLKLRRLWAWWLYFLDGEVHWRDRRDKKGFCRANRLFFMDYTERFFWFNSVEIGTAAAMGVLDAIKLGDCGGVVVTLIVLLLAFLLFVVIFRPYNAPFNSYFQIVVAGLQLLGAAFTAGAIFGTDANGYEAKAEITATMGIYLLIGKTALDLLPKITHLVLFVAAACCSRRKKRDPRAVHEDLTRQLIEAVQSENVHREIEVRDHAAAAEVERGNAGVNSAAALELPEVDADDDIWILSSVNSKRTNVVSDLPFEAYELDLQLLASVAAPSPTAARTVFAPTASESALLELTEAEDGAAVRLKHRRNPEDNEFVRQQKERQQQQLERGSTGSADNATQLTTPVPAGADPDLERILAGVDEGVESGRNKSGTVGSRRTGGLNKPEELNDDELKERAMQHKSRLGQLARVVPPAAPSTGARHSTQGTASADGPTVARDPDCDPAQTRPAAEGLQGPDAEQLSEEEADRMRLNLL